MKALAARRRHPLATVLIMLLGLVLVGTGYSAVAPSRAEASTAVGEADIAAGRALFLANCSTCHGLQAEGTDQGPTLIGVGAAAVDFQVGTGRMPLQADSIQAPARTVDYTEEQIAQLSAYVASLAPGPAIPPEELTVALDDPERISEGNELFRTNCAMCHNVVGAGGALTRGKYAPSLEGVSGKHVYEAMQTGPQSMPVFNDENITPEEKQSIISYLSYVEEEPNPGGLLKLGSLGPVSEGLFAWTVGIALLVACAVWLATRAS
ncbi:c-type cytochrome [Quadrisphaera sp. DSM 44207]|uniref:cytochrome bc1 complex diheme cytochrome c subunit n=1 Tax=Quadrisphaera sp. DSM 44207 TaxID=1881057 RepID=UPI00088D71CC|nr:c-type cytochrome [Quadrisphaera sp. DSM 44207]SDQ33177.1 menaquinol-cytochrome c reductase cytochrome c1 subunit precursor [Quadrisphaera sp. DSM 44207]